MPGNSAVSADDLFSRKNADFKLMIDTCASAESLSIIVGAGSSAEAGLPRWSQLIERYLALAIEMRRNDSALDSAELQAPAEIAAILRNAFDGSAKLATIGDMLIGPGRRRPVLSLALYPSSTRPVPGPTAKAIAGLLGTRSRFGKRTTIVTTNYDEILEDALRDAGVGQPTPRTIEDLPTERRGGKRQRKSVESRMFKNDAGKHGQDIDVWHLHGYVPFTAAATDGSPGGGGAKEPILFSEKEYSLYQAKVVEALAAVLSRGPALLVGLSIADWDLVASAYYHSNSTDGSASPSSSAGSHHFALVLDRSMDEFPPVVRRLEHARLESMGLHPLKSLKSYSQIPQAIYEIDRATSVGEKYWSKHRYGSRLRRWRRRFDQTYPESSVVLSEQSAICGHLARDLQRIRKELFLESLNDHLGLHVWVREFPEYCMSLWASTEYARRSYESPSYRVSVQDSQRFLAVRQAYFGVASPSLEPVNDSRWRQVLSVPLVLEEGDKSFGKLGRLMIGVVTLSTDQGLEDSGLGRALHDDRSLKVRLIHELETAGKALLLAKRPPGSVSGG